MAGTDFWKWNIPEQLRCSCVAQVSTYTLSSGEMMEINVVGNEWFVSTPMMTVPVS